MGIIEDLFILVHTTFIHLINQIVYYQQTKKYK